MREAASKVKRSREHLMAKFKDAFDDPQHWRDRAEEVRLIAEDMNHGESKATMFRIADEYDRLRRKAEERAKRSLEQSTISSRVGD
jgi:ribosomal protein S17E